MLHTWRSALQFRYLESKRKEAFMKWIGNHFQAEENTIWMKDYLEPSFDYLL